MKRTFILGAAVALGWLSVASPSQAQVFIRAPFVRVGVGDGVYVRTPFVNLYVPPSGPVYGPRVIYLPPPIVVQSPPAESEAIPLPQAPPIPKADPNAPPLPLQPVPVQTLESFSRSFQPKGGSFDTTVINPVTNQPTALRFSLPEGTPRRVLVSRDSIEFVYRIGQWVRIDFDRDGAKVTSRN